ncbi:hypothetical protein [uncultured Campylobacter sp.]|nr:hypothetical protein [uncultured Campylobacter sp.]
MEIQKDKINLVGVWALNLTFAKFRLLLRFGAMICALMQRYLKN